MKLTLIESSQRFYIFPTVAIDREKRTDTGKYFFFYIELCWGKWGISLDVIERSSSEVYDV